MDEPKPDAPKNENVVNGTGSTPVQPTAVVGNQAPNGTPDAVKAELSKMAGSDQGHEQPAGVPPAAPISPNQAPKSNKPLFIISLVMVFVVAVGVGYATYIKSNAKKPTTAQTTSSATPPPAVAPQSGPTSIQTEEQDTERQTDINAVDSHLEAFYADQGFYPTLANMNTASWFNENMKGLDPAALQDPQGMSETLVSAPQAKAYAYVSADDKGEACDNVKFMCTKFYLTAVLSTGRQYQKTSL
ncbi:MAG TPA: hypothetical protein VLG47_02260 [Candidatus Saccharimonadales bacterium]|nr:hypothetical protein [Candidatus Saccharimonadales bacterium]